MDSLLELLEKLRETEGAIARLEKAILEYPDSPTLISSLKSLRKRQQHLEAIFADISHRQSLDVCTYRLFTEQDSRPTLKSLSSTLLSFQELYTLVYDALKHGPKVKSQVSAEVAANTAFGFAYTISGSIGVVLTMPNERLLIGETMLEEAIIMLFDMVKASTSTQIANFAQKVGVAPIRKMYTWAWNQVQAGLGSEIQWRRKQEVRASLFIQPPELEALERAIAATSEEVEDTFEFTGRLIGADIKAHTFHIEYEGADIRGKMSENIGLEASVELPRLYKAKITKRTKIHYALEKEDVNYFLISLYPC